jgi:1-acyl-sn-glycerol-3-phosphate acyltransferase
MTAPAASSSIAVSRVLGAPSAARRAPARASAPGGALRSHAFNAIFLAYTFLFVLCAYPLLLLPSRTPLARAMKAYASGVLGLMRRVVGIRLELRGRANLPAGGAYILASKHQSEADGIVQMALVDDLAFIAMKEVAKYPLVGPVLRKLEMVLVDTDGGAREHATLAEGARKAAAAGRPILIYPEGTLMKVGERGRYRAGVYHLARDLGLPVIPVATDLGLRWDRRQKIKRRGPAAVAFLPALRAGADKRAFMAALEEAIEAESARLAEMNRS